MLNGLFEKGKKMINTLGKENTHQVRNRVAAKLGYALYSKEYAENFIIRSLEVAGFSFFTGGYNHYVEVHLHGELIAHGQQKSEVVSGSKPMIQHKIYLNNRYDEPFILLKELSLLHKIEEALGFLPNFEENFLLFMKKFDMLKKEEQDQKERAFIMKKEKFITTLEKKNKKHETKLNKFLRIQPENCYIVKTTVTETGDFSYKMIDNKEDTTQADNSTKENKLVNFYLFHRQDVEEAIATLAQLSTLQHAFRYSKETTYEMEQEITEKQAIIHRLESQAFVSR